MEKQTELTAEEIEVLEDAADAILADKAYEQWIASGRKSCPIEKLWRELHLDDDG